MTSRDSTHDVEHERNKLERCDDATLETTRDRLRAEVAELCAEPEPGRALDADRRPAKEPSVIIRSWRRRQDKTGVVGAGERRIRRRTDVADSPEHWLLVGVPATGRGAGGSRRGIASAPSAFALR
mgnify:CR=1 FL=1